MSGQVYILQQPEVDKLIKDVSEIKDFIMSFKSQEVEKTISHKEAALFLNITPDTLTRRIKNQTYPGSIVHSNGTKKEYYKSELKELLNKKRSK
jgi:hypothetical protein